MPMSIGWGAADVTLSAYIQANVGSKEGVQPENISEIGAALGFRMYISLSRCVCNSLLLFSLLSHVDNSLPPAFYLHVA